MPQQTTVKETNGRRPLVGPNLASGPTFAPISRIFYLCLIPPNHKASPVMDHFDRGRYITVYTTLAEILERDRPRDPEQQHLSHVLGDLARRVFVGSDHIPPDELLEETARMLRSSDLHQVQAMAQRLRAHARHLSDLDVGAHGKTTEPRDTET